MSTVDYRIVALSALREAAREQALSGAEAIFFDMSATRNFETAAVKSAFRARWFGTYAQECPEAFLLALTPSGDVLGYIAGCFDSFSTRAQAITRDIFYYTDAFKQAVRAYPSHFHINVRRDHQGQGTGHALNRCFLDLCGASGSTGVHVVTDVSSRAVRFYERCGFAHITRPNGTSGHLALLVRDLSSINGENFSSA